MQVLLDTKKEYTKYIQESISISIAQKINNYYDDATKNNLGMKGFQNNLNLIKKWNDETISEECEFLIKHSKYKNLDKIYNFTIQTYIKLRLIELNIDILHIENEYEYPNLEKFIHKCYINVSIWAWKNPFLFFKNNLKQIEIQNNYNIIEKNIKKIITNTLRECVPIDKIINNLRNTNNIVKNIKDYQLNNDYFKEDIKLNENKVINNNNFLNSFINFAKNSIYKNKEDFTIHHNKNLISNDNLYLDKEKKEIEKKNNEEENDNYIEVNERDLDSQLEKTYEKESKEASAEEGSEQASEQASEEVSEQESEQLSEQETEEISEQESEQESEKNIEKETEKETEKESEKEKEKNIRPKKIKKDKKSKKKETNKSLNIQKKKSKFIIDSSSSEENSDNDNDNNNIKKVIW